MQAFLKALAPAILLILSGCNSIEDKTGGASPDVQAAGTLDFALMSERLFGPRCLSCHVQYATYTGVRAELEAIAKAVESNRMPKGAPLPGPLKALLRDWIQNGAPEKIGAPPPTAPAELEPTWASVSSQLVHPRCTVCHSPNGQARFLDLSTRQAWFQARDRVFADGTKLLDSENPAASYLVRVVRDETEPMPPVWSNLERLQDAQILVLEEWIRLGLP